MGMTAVLDAAGQLAGIFTDGDLRRFLEHGDDPRTAKVGAVMSRHPVTIEADALAAEAVRRMEERLVSQLLVVDGQGKLVGALHIHDLLSAKVV
jgi:arabinose-5-phosphate isomerase